ncbi:MAG: type II secretory pathway pseudopilin PulG [Pseudohongiellaceae bacterium]|jgi:type II secretory pathway pseudopilin PulG
MRSSEGFSLLELIMVLAMVTMMGSLAVPVYAQYATRAGLVETTIRLANWSREFHRWEMNNGRFPNDSHIVLPPEAVRTLNIVNSEWLAPTALGGNWNWEGVGAYDYVGISIVGATASISDISQLDSILDDGDLSQGVFRQTRNGRYTYILEE